MLPCLKKSNKLVVINKEKYSEIKNDLYDLTDVKKVEVSLDNYQCNNHCKNCRFLYDVEAGFYETFCNGDEQITFALCIGSFENMIDAKEKLQTQSYLLATLTTVFGVMALMTAAFFCLRKFKRNSSSTMVS